MESLQRCTSITDRPDVPFIHRCKHALHAVDNRPAPNITEDQLAAGLLFEGQSVSLQRLAKCFVSQDDVGQPQAIIIFHYGQQFNNGHLHIQVSSVYVEPDARRAGHATALFKALTTHMAEIDAAAIYLIRNDLNVPAINFYKSIGIETPANARYATGTLTAVSKMLDKQS